MIKFMYVIPTKIVKVENLTISHNNYMNAYFCCLYFSAFETALTILFMLHRMVRVSSLNPLVLLMQLQIVFLKYF